MVCRPQNSILLLAVVMCLPNITPFFCFSRRGMLRKKQAMHAQECHCPSRMRMHALRGHRHQSSMHKLRNVPFQLHRIGGRISRKNWQTRVRTFCPWARRWIYYLSCKCQVPDWMETHRAVEFSTPMWKTTTELNQHKRMYVLRAPFPQFNLPRFLKRPALHRPYPKKVLNVDNVIANEASSAFPMYCLHCVRYPLCYQGIIQYFKPLQYAFETNDKRNVI